MEEMEVQFKTEYDFRGNIFACNQFSFHFSVLGLFI